ncbi:MAG: hypothetical protein ACO4CH_04865 [Saprospiraceae bacterium]
MSDIAKTSELNFQVGLDADNIPVDIQWSARENGEGQITKISRAFEESFRPRFTRHLQN